MTIETYQNKANEIAQRKAMRKLSSIYNHALYK